MAGNEDIARIAVIVDKETKEYGKLNDNLIETIHKVVYALVQDGFTVRYTVSERYVKEFQLTSNLLELKLSNNGGFGHSVNEENEGLVTMAVSFMGIKTILAVPFKDISMIYVVGESGLGIDLGSIITAATWERYNNLLGSAVPHSEEYEPLDVPKELPADRVVNITDYRKK